MFGAGLQPPVIAAAQIAKRQPDAGVQSLVIDRVGILLRRVLTRHLHAGQGFDMREIRSGNLFVPEDIGGDIGPRNSDDQSVVAFVKSHHRLGGMKRTSQPENAQDCEQRVTHQVMPFQWGLTPFQAVR